MHEIWQKVTRLIENEDWNNREPIADSGEALRWIPEEDSLLELARAIWEYSQHDDDLRHIADMLKSAAPDSRPSTEPETTITHNKIYQRKPTFPR